MLDAAIDHGKEHRRPYFGSARFDRGCRNHGACGWCEDNRTYNTRRRLTEATDKLREHHNREED